MKRLSLLLMPILALFASCDEIATDDNDAYIVINESTLNVPAEGGNFDIAIEANVEYEIINNYADWITCTKSTTGITLQIAESI